MADLAKAQHSKNHGFAKIGKAVKPKSKIYRLSAHDTPNALANSFSELLPSFEKLRAIAQKGWRMALIVFQFFYAPSSSLSGALQAFSLSRPELFSATHVDTISPEAL